VDRSLASGPIVWLGIIVTTCLLLVLFQTMLWLVLPLLLAVVSYYLLSPLVHLAMARGLTRDRAVFIVTVMLTIFLGAAGSLVGPKIMSASHNWQGNLASYALTGTDLVTKAKQSVFKYFPFLQPPAPKTEGTGVGSIGFVGSGPAAEPSSGNDLENQIENQLATNSSGIVSELVRWIPSLLLVPYMTYFFLLDGPRFKRFLVRAIPNAFFEKTLYLFYRVEDQIRRYFQGLLALTALDAIFLGVGLWILGLKAPFFLATLAAVMAWLPYLGSIAGGLMVVLVAAHNAPDNAWLPYEVVGLFIAVRMLDDFVFLPLTVGRSLRMHPLVTVLMILLGGAVAGIPGLLLVMPVLGVVMVAGQIIGELLTDERVLARHRHGRHLRKLRAMADL
jgi:predicted PurR-regulated permease PerM